MVVVAGIDTSDLAEEVMRAARSVVESTANAELHLVHSIPLIPTGADAFIAAAPPLTPRLAGEPVDVVQAGRDYLDDCVTRITTGGPSRVIGHLTSGNPATALLQIAAAIDADLVVVGSHSKGRFERLLLGSVAEALVRKASCPVLITRPKHYAQEHVPEIAPPCQDCLELQKATAGRTLWCARHATHRPKSRLHYEYPQSFALGSMFFQA